MTRRLLPAALFALLLPGCPLSDQYYVDPNADQPGAPAPRCGDGVLDGAEACDGAALGDESCEDLGLGSGVLACKPDCRYDVSGCAAPAPVCGDGVAQAAEACDGSDLRGQTCATLGLAAGSLACTAACDFDVSGCTPVACGDGLAQAAEACDGSDLRGQTCTTLGLAGGTLACTPTCSFDLSGCTANAAVCGDDRAEGSEACDGADTRGETCDTLGLGAGTLACTSTCAFDTSGCGSDPGCSAGSASDCCQPEPEVCDGISNDCDAEVDEGGVCPTDCSARQFDGHVYLLCIHPSAQDQEDYGQATTTCQSAGALLGLDVQLDLARLESAEENAFAEAWIVESATQAGMVWMGANDLAQEGRWVWGQGPDAVQFFRGRILGGGTAYQGAFNDWAPGRPYAANNVDEDCGAFDSDFDWKWNDLACGTPRLGLLCEQVD